MRKINMIYMFLMIVMLTMMANFHIPAKKMGRASPGFNPIAVSNYIYNR